jgi:putative ABC transport system substrate-binding protein
MSRHDQSPQKFLVIAGRLLFVLPFLALLMVVSPVFAEKAASKTDKNISRRPTVVVLMIIPSKKTNAEDRFIELLKTNRKYNFRFDIFSFDNHPEKLYSIIRNLNKNRYRIVYTYGKEATLSARERIKGLPIVFNGVESPVEDGIIQSWYNPGGNICGISNSVPMAKVIKPLNQLIGNAKIAFLYDPENKRSEADQREFESLRSTIDLDLIKIEFGNSDDPEKTVAELKAAGVKGVMLQSSDTITAKQGELAKLLAAAKIATSTTSAKLITKYDILLGVRPDKGFTGESAAMIVETLVEGGDKLHEERAKRCEKMRLTVNSELAKSIGIKIPKSSIKQPCNLEQGL